WLEVSEMDLEEDDGLQPDMAVNAPGADASGEEGDSRRDLELVSKIARRIKDDKKHHEKAFKRMRRDMRVAMWGAEETWHEDNYKANIIGRHIKAKTAALYAKNPKAVASRRETLDFAVWDENP